MWHTLSSRSFHLKNYQSDHVYQLLVILHLFIEYKLLLLGFISTALEIKSSDQLVLHFTRLICDERTQIGNCKYSICHVISHLIISIRFTRDEICCSCFSRFTLFFFHFVYGPFSETHCELSYRSSHSKMLLTYVVFLKDRRYERIVQKAQTRTEKR